MKIMYGASTMLYGGTSYGSKVDGAPAMVRRFDVVSETSRSYVLQGGMKVPKKKMVYDAGNFTIPMFWSTAEAVDSLRPQKT